MRVAKDSDVDPDLVGSGSGRLGLDLDLGPNTVNDQISTFLACVKAIKPHGIPVV
jgi:hypothetical protein